MDCAPYSGEIDGDIIYIDIYSVKWLRLTEIEEGYRWEFHLDGRWLFFAVLGGFTSALLEWVYHLAEKFFF